MIVKPWTERDTTDPRRRAGHDAERQMAFYLHRAFAGDADLLVLNDLRMVDASRPEHDGRPGVCQIDHLVLHRWGAIIVESKSVTGEVAVRGDGSGGDEWTRRVRGTDQGIPSPIQQGRRQAEFLRACLQAKREELVGKIMLGFRTVSKMINGTDQRGFRNMPIQVIVAISDSGSIRRGAGWREPQEPFRFYVTKADLVADKINEEYAKHRSASSIFTKSNGEYGLWAMKQDEVARVAEFLAGSHVDPVSAPPLPPPRPAQSLPALRPPPPQSPKAPPPLPPPPLPPAPLPTPHTAGPGSVTDRPTCKQCGGVQLTALWGKFGYYWKCACGVNTSMPTVCAGCGAEGRRGETVRIRKAGLEYLRECSACGKSERVWMER